MTTLSPSAPVPAAATAAVTPSVPPAPSVRRSAPASAHAWSPTAEHALDAALQAAMAHYRARNPGSAAQWAQAAQALPGGNTRSVLFHPPFPLAMARGEGCRLWDVDGHGYIDALGEFTAGLYGHSDPVIRAALHEAVDAGLSLSSHNTREAALAQEIQRRFSSMELLRFTNSGTEANLMALAVAKVHTGRSKVMVFGGAYHGGVLSFGGVAPGASPGPSVNVPHDYVVATYNDLEQAQALVRTHGADLAAILVEPMLGSGGCLPGDPAFLHGLRALADGCGALLVLDEVMTSRLAWGGRQQQLGLRPDLTTAGKYLGGGLSFGVFGGRADVMARFDPRRADALAHAGTFNNNVLSMAAGYAGLSQVLTDQALQAVNARGDALREQLNALFVQQGVALQATGLGSLLTLHATAAPLHRVADLAQSDARVKDLLFFGLLERGIFMARRGMMALSLPLGEAECSSVLAAMADVLDAHRGVLPRR